MRWRALTIYLLFVIQQIYCQDGDLNNDHWVEPHDWSQRSFSEDFRCSQCPLLTENAACNIEDGLALIYFKKFVTLLLNRKQLRYDAALNNFQRSMLFTLLPEQVNELESVKDVRDLDILLTKIVEQARPAPLLNGEATCEYTQMGSGVRALIFDIFKDIFQILKISEVQFFLIVQLVIATGWLVHKRYKFRVSYTIIIGFALFGYFYTYVECNRKMDIEDMIEVLHRYEPDSEISNPSMFGRLKKYVIGDDTSERKKELLRKSSSIKMPFCRPDHVLIMYFNEIFFKQLEILLEKVTHTIVNMRSILPFPFNLVAPLAILCLVGYVIKLTFKYILSPKAWAALLHGRPTANYMNAQQEALGNGERGDRLSGENLKMLLNVISSSSGNIANTTTQPLPVVSGVQELHEPLGMPPALGEKVVTNVNVTIGKLNESSSSGDICNTDSALDEGFTLVDDDSDDGVIEAKSKSGISKKAA